MFVTTSIQVRTSIQPMGIQDALSPQCHHAVRFVSPTRNAHATAAERSDDFKLSERAHIRNRAGAMQQCLIAPQGAETVYFPYVYVIQYAPFRTTKAQFRA
jgi:hypothetical protein